MLRSWFLGVPLLVGLECLFGLGWGLFGFFEVKVDVLWDDSLVGKWCWVSSFEVWMLVVGVVELCWYRIDGLLPYWSSILRG